MTKSPRIIFMGTPEFAVPSLDILVQHGYEVVAVVTATDKLGGRGGKQLLESAVKKYALAHGIPVLQPPNLKAPEFLEELASYQADLQIVVAFRMLPEAVWTMPAGGTFNLHGSLLPKYRGAAPINWAVIRGEAETGVTTFFLQHEIDTGHIILQEKLPISPNETAGEVHDRMMELGAAVVLKTVQLIQAGAVQPQPQDDTRATSAPKLKPENTRIDFGARAQDVHNFVRGLNPYPGAWCMVGNKKWKIFRTLPLVEEHRLEPGTPIHTKDSLRIAVGDGFVEVLELQLPGKRRMAIRDFLNGYHASLDEELMFS
jgi:methionyl-tRNA formyltransferase